VKRILLIQTAFLGDVILATPVLSELFRLFPDAEIDVLVKKGNESLLENHPAVHTIYTLDKKLGKRAAIRKLIAQFRTKHYDLVINLHRFGSSGWMAGRSGGKKRYGFKKNPFSFLYTKRFEHHIGDGTHEVTRNLSLIKEFGAEQLVRPSLYPSLEDEKSSEPYRTGSYLCMAPTSVWFTKQMPKEKWLELIASLPGKRIYLLGGPDDAAYCDEIRKEAGSLEVVNLAGQLSLLASAALMRDAQHNYVNDSGPMHLASAMNAPTTAFFCSTIPNFGFGPLAEGAVIREVLGLDCRPCGLHGHRACPKGHFKCGLEIDVTP